MTKYLNKTKHNDKVSLIISIQFGVLAPEEILKRSVAHISESTLYDSNGEPRKNGLFDPRMGGIERNKKCKTCEQNYVLCPGHFGHIEIAKPVFNIQFIDQITRILQCVCIQCSKLLINKTEPIIQTILKYKKYEERLDLIHLNTKVSICGSSLTNNTIEVIS